MFATMESRSKVSMQAAFGSLRESRGDHGERIGMGIRLTASGT
jgi:hypothetical protein